MWRNSSGALSLSHIHSFFAVTCSTAHVILCLSGWKCCYQLFLLMFCSVCPAVESYIAAYMLMCFSTTIA